MARVAFDKMRATVGSFRSARVDRLFLAVLAIWFCIAKLIATGYYLSDKDTVFELSFGFGSYVESLYKTGTFASCASEGCVRASRMPLLPLIYLSLAQITTGLMKVTFVKNLLLSLFTTAAFVYLWRRQSPMDGRELRPWILVCLAIACAPPVIKHASFPHYEEGFLLEMLFIWTIAWLTVIKALANPLHNPAERGPVVLCTLLGLAAFMMKSSMLLVFAGSWMLALIWASRYRDIRVFAVILLSAVAVLSWGMRNHAVTGHFSIMSSWDGSNAYRGSSESGYRLYPDVNLDRLFDAPVAWKEDGEAVVISPLPKLKELKNEWASDGYLRSLAWQWVEEHPSDALSFAVRKAYVFFIGIRKTPYTYTNDARSTADQSRVEQLTISGWLLAGRLLELALIVVLFRLWRRRDVSARALVWGSIALNMLYAAPYLVGFSYERHITVYLVIVAASLGFASTELFERRARARQ